MMESCHLTPIVLPNYKAVEHHYSDNQFHAQKHRLKAHGTPHVCLAMLQSLETFQVVPARSDLERTIVHGKQNSYARSVHCALHIRCHP